MLSPGYKNEHANRMAGSLESTFALLHPLPGHRLDGCRRAFRVSASDFSVPATEIVENSPLFAALSAFCLHISIETGMQCAEPSGTLWGRKYKRRGFLNRAQGQ